MLTIIYSCLRQKWGRKNLTTCSCKDEPRISLLPLIISALVLKIQQFMKLEFMRANMPIYISLMQKHLRPPHTFKRTGQTIWSRKRRRLQVKIPPLSPKEGKGDKLLLQHLRGCFTSSESAHLQQNWQNYATAQPISEHALNTTRLGEQTKPSLFGCVCIRKIS